MESDGSGATGPAVGGSSTPGFEGPWPVPDGARVLTFDLTGFDEETGLANEEPDGTLTIDLKTQTAIWTATA